MKLHISLTVVQPPRAMRGTLPLQKLRHLDEQNLVINLGTTPGSAHKKIGLHKEELSALLVNNATALITAGISILNKHLNSRRQISI
jgi:hypothetical protein